MKAIFVIFMIVAIIGMAMAGHHHHTVTYEKAPAPEDSNTFFDNLAQGADNVAHGIASFFG